jgi:hypothetical protein
MVIANYPDVQDTTRKELDTLLETSPSRLPDHGDEAKLPFIVAMVKELLRWHVSDQNTGFSY